MRGRLLPGRRAVGIGDAVEPFLQQGPLVSGQGGGLRQDGAQRNRGGDRAGRGRGGGVGDDRGDDGLPGYIGQRQVAPVAGQGDQRERRAAAGGVDQLRGAFFADPQPPGLGDPADVPGSPCLSPKSR